MVLCNVGVCSLSWPSLSGGSRHDGYLEVGVFLSKMVLHMQQVLGCQLTEAKDAQEIEVCQVACVLRIQVTKSYNANDFLQRVQICVTDLQAIMTYSYATAVCHTLWVGSPAAGCVLLWSGNCLDYVCTSTINMLQCMKCRLCNVCRIRSNVAQLLS